MELNIYQWEYLIFKNIIIKNIIGLRYSHYILTNTNSDTKEINIE
jgi:hypothetical protein